MRLLASMLVLLYGTGAYALPINQKLPLDSKALDMKGFTKDYDFEGIIKLDNCSGALVRLEGAKDTDKALVMSNGHCVPRGFMGFIPPNKFVQNEASARAFSVLGSDGAKIGTVRSTKILYATMTGTDVSIYELAETYGDILTKFNTKALILDSKHPEAGDQINIISGYWTRGYTCSVDKFIHELHEENYVWKDSLRYSEDNGGCETIHGTSGSPIINATTGKVIGVNNTGNDDGQECTMNNPCEVSEDGEVYFKQGLSYGQQTYQIYSCIEDGKINLHKEGCTLFH